MHRISQQWRRGRKANAKRRRQKNRCFLCGEMLSDHPSIDHVWPRSWGGIDAPVNYAFTHENCNKIKADQLPSNMLIRRLANLNGDEYDANYHKKLWHSDLVTHGNEEDQPIKVFGR